MVSAPSTIPAVVMNSNRRRLVPMMSNTAADPRTSGTPRERFTKYTMAAWPSA
jgi:hypothetical protein